MEDWKERCRDEHAQICSRLARLEAMIVRFHEGTLRFEPACPIGLLERQAAAMREYRDALEERNAIEHMW